MAEGLCSGLQLRVRRFESDSSLQHLPDASAGAPRAAAAGFAWLGRVVPRERLELSHGFPYQILSLARLPISPPRQARRGFCANERRSQPAGQVPSWHLGCITRPLCSSAYAAAGASLLSFRRLAAVGDLIRSVGDAFEVGSFVRESACAVLLGALAELAAKGGSLGGGVRHSAPVGLADGRADFRRRKRPKRAGKPASALVAASERGSEREPASPPNRPSDQTSLTRTRVP